MNSDHIKTMQAKVKDLKPLTEGDRKALLFDTQVGGYDPVMYVVRVMFDLTDATNNLNETTNHLSKNLEVALYDLKETTATYSTNLKAAIDDFNKASTKLGNKMLWLTIAIGILTLIATVVALVQIYSRH